MMFINKIIFSSILVCLGFVHLANAEGEKTITYKNQRGSILTIAWQNNINNTGSLFGTFTTAVGNCKEDMNMPMPIAGYYNSNVVSISVNFPNCKQLVAMVGNLSEDKTQLNTLWLDASESKDPQDQNWNANIIGADIYKIIK